LVVEFLLCCSRLGYGSPCHILNDGRELIISINVLSTLLV
jgi:hypothetical protein